MASGSTPTTVVLRRRAARYGRSRAGPGRNAAATAFRDHNDRPLLVLIVEERTGDRVRAERAKHARRDRGGPNSHGIAVAAEDDASTCPPADFSEAWRSSCHATYAVLLKDPNRGAKPPRVSFRRTSRSAVGHGSGFHEDAVRHAEQRGRRRDAERHRENDERGEAGLTRQQTERISEVLRESAKPGFRGPRRWCDGWQVGGMAAQRGRVRHHLSISRSLSRLASRATRPCASAVVHRLRVLCELFDDVVVGDVPRGDERRSDAVCQSMGFVTMPASRARRD
jgi:hypothetical protein